MLSRGWNRAAWPLERSRLHSLPGYLKDHSISAGERFADCALHVWHGLLPGLPARYTGGDSRYPPRRSDLVVLGVRGEYRFAAFPIISIERVD
jgi:hypothetical protein